MKIDLKIWRIELLGRVCVYSLLVCFVLVSSCHRRPESDAVTASGAADKAVAFLRSTGLSNTLTVGQLELRPEGWRVEFYAGHAGSDRISWTNYILTRRAQITNSAYTTLDWCYPSNSLRRLVR